MSSLSPKAVGPFILVFDKLQNLLKASQINLQIFPSGLNRNFAFQSLLAALLAWSAFFPLALC
jgi:hypothetical protein